MQFSCRLFVGFMRIFRRLEQPEIVVGAVTSNMCLPFAACGMPRNSFVSGLVRVGAFQVVHLLKACRRSKVAPSIVGGLPVFVVDFVRGKFSCHDGPRNVVHSQNASIDGHKEIARIVESTDNLADSAFAAPYLVREDTSLWVIAENSLKAFSGRFLLGHIAIIHITRQKWSVL